MFPDDKWSRLAIAHATRNLLRNLSQMTLKLAPFGTDPFNAMRVERCISLRMRISKRSLDWINPAIRRPAVYSLMEQVRQKRIAMNLEQGALGKILGFSKRSMSRWEFGGIQPGIEAKRRLVEWLGLDPENSK